jgi:cell division cycle 14
MSLSMIVKFIEGLDHQMVICHSDTIVYFAPKGPRPLTNAVFLLGAYMVLKLGMHPTEISKRFDRLDEDLIEPFRDATFSPPDFGLLLFDCWAGLRRAMDVKWIAPPSLLFPRVWGRYNIDEYLHHDSALHGALHVVVPGKLIAFAGPVELPGGRAIADDARGVRAFGPAYYTAVLRALGASTVVRLCAPRYDPAAFAAAGLAHRDLPFPDCTAPPPDVVARFLRIADAAPGLVAVHCRAGLGRTGTLAALYAMRRHGFAAREAIAWLRIVRPGCVIGEQQHYLCAVETAIRELRHAALLSAGAPPPRPAPAAPPAPDGSAPPAATCASATCAGTGPAGVAEPAAVLGTSRAPRAEAALALAAQVAEGAARRGAVRPRRCGPPPCAGRSSWPAAAGPESRGLCRLQCPPPLLAVPLPPPTPVEAGATAADGTAAAADVRSKTQGWC